ncbi:hypothetical protein EDC96DRAFT_437774 [Choanephora cucurbitarum]|nr:hypothetical protein EDC96DRAFT_437774 [Choanephora cucurbitarum]
MSYTDVLEKLLETRLNLIKDIIECYMKSSDSLVHRLIHQLKEVALVFKTTVVQIVSIFVLLEDDRQKPMIESYVNSFKQTFLIPSSCNTETSISQSAITRLFSPSSNIHLIVRFLPESIQQYLPQFDPSTMPSIEDIRQSTDGWISSVEHYLHHHLDKRLQAVDKHSDLVQIRTKIWEALREDEMAKDKKNKWRTANQAVLTSSYSVWNNLYRGSFNRHTKLLIDNSLQQLVNQPGSTIWNSLVNPKTLNPQKDLSVTMHVWPDLNSKHQTAFVLPNLSSAQEIRSFKTSLTETVHDRTSSLSLLQNEFDMILSDITKDVKSYLMNDSNMNDECFHVKNDTNMIKNYFEDKCFETVQSYSREVNVLLKRIAGWTDHETANGASIFLGRLVRNICLLSKELPNALSISIDAPPTFELRSRIDQNPKYSQAQKIFTDTFHDSHNIWLDYLQKKYAEDLEKTLLSTKWNDQCPAQLVWDSMYFISVFYFLN